MKRKDNLVKEEKKDKKAFKNVQIHLLHQKDITRTFRLNRGQEKPFPQCTVPAKRYEFLPQALRSSRIFSRLKFFGTDTLDIRCDIQACLLLDRA